MCICLRRIDSAQAGQIDGIGLDSGAFNSKKMVSAT
jgi:hypothetical protein